MHSLTPPKIILFDWHGTLADTYDAMYNALDDLFPRLATGGLLDRLMNPESSKTLEDAKLVNYVRKYQKLPPKIKRSKWLGRYHAPIFSKCCLVLTRRPNISRMSYTMNVTAVTMEKCTSLKRTPGSVC